MWEGVGHTLGGFVAGEGWFGTKRRAIPFARDRSPRLTFVFAVAVAQRDRRLLEALERFLGHGTIIDRPRRKSHHQPIAEFSISSARAHRQATIPFAERFLLPSEKRRQFESWRESLDEYVGRQAELRRVRSTCSEAGCDRPVRGRGLCRSHYYRVTGY